MSESRDKPRGLGAAARVTALASSVMDLHVRIALQEMDREKRRLISGGVFLAMGGVLMIFALLAIETLVVIWMKSSLNLEFEWILIILAGVSEKLAIDVPLRYKLLASPFLTNAT